MPINAHPEYIAAEKEYLQTKNLEEKLEKLKKMISLAPSHKGAENLRAQLKTRLKKLKEQISKTKKTRKTTQIGIKKEDMQAVLIGKTNSGKSSLLSILTNAKAKISSNKFTTTQPTPGIMDYGGVQIQLIENPAIESEYYDKGLPNTTDTLLILVTRLEEIEEIRKIIEKASAKQIIIFNKMANLTEEEIRKVKATLESRKYNFVLISTKTQEGISELKEKIFTGFDNLRIYTKEPGKEKSPRPMILKPNSTVKDVAEKILKGFSEKIKETKIWGPSSKFAGQKVGLQHKLKNLDIVEFRTR